MKTVLSLWHVENKGKTETLRAVANLLLKNYPTCKPVYPTPAIVPDSGDFRLVVQVNGKTVGVESQGDPRTNLQDRLLDLADNYGCDVIFCTSRTRGDTVTAVDNLYHTRGFDTIWTSTYQIAGESQQNAANELKAVHMLDLLVKHGRL